MPADRLVVAQKSLLGAVASRMGLVSQPVLPMLPAEARSIGPSAGLLEGPEGGVVFVFGLATFSYAADDEAGRRLAAVQLVRSKIALSVDVASAFGVTGVTWKWGRDYGVGGLLRSARGPRGPSKLTEQLRARIVELDATGLSLLAVAAQTGVSTATVRVALGRVLRTSTIPTATSMAAAGIEPADGPLEDDLDASADSVRSEQDAVPDAASGAGLVVLAAPAARAAERVAARFGDLTEASVVITQGAQLPLAGLLLALPALEMTGLLSVAAQVFTPMRKGFYGLRVTLLMTLFMALLREPRAEGATRLRPADLGRLLGLDRAPEVKTLRRKLAELADQNKGAELQAALGRHHVLSRPEAVGFQRS